MIELNDIPSELCYIAPYCEILKHLGYFVDEESLFCITGGIEFKYSYIHNNKQVEEFEIGDDGVSIEGARDITLEIEKIFGVYFKENCTKNKEQLIDFFQMELEHKKPVICFLDVYELPYHPQYGQLHGQTNVLLYGMSADKKNYYVYDKHVTTIPISTYYGEVSCEVIEKALIFGGNIFNGREVGVISYEKSGHKKNVDVNNQMEIMAKRMLKKGCKFKGVEGIRYFAQDILRWQELWNEEQLRRVCKEVYFHINGRGGPYVSRKVFAAFLKREGMYDNELVEKAEKSVRLWHALAIRFFRNSVNINSRLLKEISNMVIELSFLEEEVYKMIGSPSVI